MRWVSCSLLPLVMALGWACGDARSDQGNPDETSDASSGPGHGSDSGFDAEAEGDGRAPLADGSARSPARGLFLDEASLVRARARHDDDSFGAGHRLVLSRAQSALDSPVAPFELADVTTIRYGWCAADSGRPGTLSKATGDFERGSDQFRTLALAFALTEDPTWAEAAVAQMRTWAEKQTLVNVYDFGANLRAGTLAGQTDGFCSDRPWNFALDVLFQGYGLINAADAYLLLTRNGHTLAADDDALLRDWLRRTVEAINSSFRAWTEWADAHPNSSSYERYRSDNHLSWGLAALIAGATALEDTALSSYVLDNGSFEDRRGGRYANPSGIEQLIDLAIEAGGANEGRIYEERILRDPPIGYSLYHLWAMALVAQVAEVHHGRDVWSFTGADGVGLHAAFVRYAAFITGERPSPEPTQDRDLGSRRWLYELAYRRWQTPEVRAPLDLGPRNQYILQSIGPVSLLLGR